MSCVAVIPARRAERTLAATLESLRLGNADFVERVLVVTSENDTTADVARAWRAHDERVELVLAARDRTAGRARCDGFAAARSSMSDATRDTTVLFVDADCRLEAGGARRLAERMNDCRAAAVTPRIAREGGLVARARHILEFKEAASRRPAPGRWLPPSTVMLCRGDAFDRAGGFPDLWPGEDLVFTQTLRDLGETVVRSADVVAWHRHPFGMLEMLRHQSRLGRTAAVARRRTAMHGSSLARRPLMALALLPGRMLRTAVWQAGEGAAAVAWTLVLLPLIVAGLTVWTAAFAREAASA